MYVFSVFHRVTVDEIVIPGVRRAHPPAEMLAGVRLVATVAPAASVTVTTSVILTAVLR